MVQSGIYGIAAFIVFAMPFSIVGKLKKRLDRRYLDDNSYVLEKTGMILTFLDQDTADNVTLNVDR